MLNGRISDRIFEALGPDEQLAVQFFAVFSRFECALKCAGFRNHNDGQISCDVKPHSEAFAKELAKNLSVEQKGKICEVAADLLNSHLRKQRISEEDKLFWYEVEKGDAEEIKWIFDLINIVRNNLFHGGKYSSSCQDNEQNRARDNLLIGSCLKVLYLCIDLHPEVREAFLFGIPEEELDV
jgi:hypothetical protein